MSTRAAEHDFSALESVASAASSLLLAAGSLFDEIASKARREEIGKSELDQAFGLIEIVVDALGDTTPETIQRLIGTAQALDLHQAEGDLH